MHLIRIRKIGAAVAIITALAGGPLVAQMSMGAVDAPTVPAVTGFSQGEEILFIHTEVSDPGIAKILTDMMGGSPVLVVPALADIPAEFLANVYVFTNGMAGDGPMGPLGGQGDIFDNPPGTPGYSPLRAINLVSWTNAMAAKPLKSMVELNAAVDAGLVSIEPAGIVANMPFLTWAGGSR